jgi:hypothetical protein
VAWNEQFHQKHLPLPTLVGLRRELDNTLTRSFPLEYPANKKRVISRELLD